MSLTDFSSNAAYPALRMRRMRRDAFSRALMAENVITSADLIYPVFVHEGMQRSEAVNSMPGVERLSLDLLLPVAADCVKLGIPVIGICDTNSDPEGISIPDKSSGTPGM